MAKNKNKNKGSNKFVEPEKALNPFYTEKNEEVTEEITEEVEEVTEKKTVVKTKKFYEVIVSVLGGKGNKIFNHKDKVTADQLNGNVEELISKGFIK